MSINNYPEYFLGSTIEEAEQVHNQFVGLLNSIAKDYALHTGLDKKDLFSEALFGLADALQAYQEDRSSNFEGFVAFKIKDRLNEYVRKYGKTVAVPRYVDRAIKIINRLNTKIEEVGIVIDINTLLTSGFDVFETLALQEYNDIVNDVKLLKNIADRANISVEKLVQRVEFIPSVISDNNIECIESYSTTNSTVELNELLSYLSDDEAQIAIGIINDKSYVIIAEELGKSNTWVANKVKIIRAKMEKNNVKYKYPNNCDKIKKGK